MKPLNRMKMASFTWMFIVALIVLASLPCFAQENYLRFNNQETVPSSNLTPSSDKSWVFIDLPLGKYRFDTSVQVEQMYQNRVSPTENDRGMEQQSLSLHFSIRW